MKWSVTLIGLLALSWSCLESGKRPQGKAISPYPAAMVGGAALDITPPIGVPLAGHGGLERRIIPWDIFDEHKYCTFFKPSEGIHDAIRAKAFVIMTGLKKLLFVSVDSVGVTMEFRDELMQHLKPLGFTDETVMLSATHTHSGPGTISNNLMWQLIASDRMIPEIREDMINGVVNVVKAAEAALEPAYLFHGSFEADEMQRNRRERPGHMDKEAQFILFQAASDNAWLGGLLNLAIHGISLPPEDLFYSADVNGAIERGVERKLRNLNGSTSTRVPVGLFINGAEGDVIPAKGGFEEMLKIGTKFGVQLHSAMGNLTPVNPTWRVVTRNVDLGFAFPNVLGCLKEPNNTMLAHRYESNGVFDSKKFKEMVLSRDGAEAMDVWLEDKTRLWTLRLGHLLLMSWPGEATTSLGLKLKQVAKDAGYRGIVMGLTNDHLAYFTTPEEYEDGGYEACASFYGKDNGDKIISEHAEAINAL